jgi:hypothetical protein
LKNEKKENFSIKVFTAYFSKAQLCSLRNLGSFFAFLSLFPPWETRTFGLGEDFFPKALKKDQERTKTKTPKKL